MLLPMVAPILSISSVETQPTCLDLHAPKEPSPGLYALVLSAIFDLLNIFFSKVCNCLADGKSSRSHEIENLEEREI